ncbi:MAG: transposase, partial [Acidobacteria bacterium]|nr:transposase [Acidobacteriota bacterium]
MADFDGGPITSDAGSLLLRRVDQHLSVSDQVAACFTDHRDPRRIRYSLRKLISQRIVSRLRGVWPQVKILLRADSGFAREE